MEAFAPELCGNAKYEHLNFFYMIVPPLTINYVDRMLSCKGKLGRRAKQNNTFTDDGFILGIAEFRRNSIAKLIAQRKFRTPFLYFNK